MPEAFVLFELMNHMVLVAEEAKSRGMRIVALNSEPLRDAGPFAVRPGLVDELVDIGSWSDGPQVRRVLNQVLERHVVGGTYAAFEATLVFEAEVRAAAGLPTTDPQRVTTALDKSWVRRTLRAAGLSGLESADLEQALTWTDWPVAGRMVVKPAHGTGSALCFIVSSTAELHAAAKVIEHGDVVNPLMKDYIFSHRGFVVEQEAAGELLSAESLVDRGKVEVVGLMGRYTLASDPVVEMGFLFPYRHPRHDEIVDAVKRMHECLGIFHGPTQMELMVPADGPIELVDCNLRLAGTASIVCFSRAFDIRYESLLVELSRGSSPSWDLLTGPTRYASEMLVLPPPEASRMGAVEFPPDVECARLMKPAGQPLTQRADQLDAVAMFVVSAGSAAEVHDRALAARAEIRFDGVPLGDNPFNRLHCAPAMGRNPIHA